MSRQPASTLDFASLTVEEPETFSAGLQPVPENIVHAVRESLASKAPRQFTVPADGPKSANVTTLVGYLRRAADADKRGLSIRTEDVKDASGKVTAVRVKFQTKESKLEGRGRKPAAANSTAKPTAKPSSK